MIYMQFDISDGNDWEVFYEKYDKEDHAKMEADFRQAIETFISDMEIELSIMTEVEREDFFYKLYKNSHYCTCLKEDYEEAEEMD